MGRIVAIASGDLGTASHDAPEYIENFTKVFTVLGCEVRALRLTAKEYLHEEIQEYISWADIVYVGGGDTIFIRNVWKRMAGFITSRVGKVLRHTCLLIRRASIVKRNCV